jgi:hypothetical protein
VTLTVEISRSEQQVIRLPAGLGVTPEEGPDVALEADRQGRHGRASEEPAEGQVDEKILG